MLPILASLDVGGTTVTLAAYSTFLFLAAAAALTLGARAATGLGVTPGRAVAGLAVAVVAGLVGARLLDAALNWSYYGADVGRIADLRVRGFALYGGMVAGLLVAVLVARAWRVSFATLADRSVPAVVAGIVLLRIGCFLNGCCAGTETSLPWGVVFPPRVGDPAGPDLGGLGLLGVTVQAGAVHPTQLYEIAAALVCGGAAWLIVRRGARAGTAALAFAAGFLLFRAADQAIRVPSPESSVPAGLIIAAYATAGLAAAAVLAWRWRAGRADVGAGPAAIRGPVRAEGVG